jgi:hypothetical protein
VEVVACLAVHCASSLESWLDRVRPIAANGPVVGPVWFEDWRILRVRCRLAAALVLLLLMAGIALWSRWPFGAHSGAGWSVAVAFLPVAVASSYGCGP